MVFIALHAGLGLRVPPIHVSLVLFEYAFLMRLFQQNSIRYSGFYIQIAHSTLSLVDKYIGLAGICLLVYVLE